MKIEKIELSGFKSFAEKTTFTLHPGITCIVGPNGSGKSNILDAFRWVLGEQSAKILRGDRMDEVIFSGSQSHKPRGMAEVNLYITFPEEGNGESGGRKIVVTRRLYRSGESEYLINRQICRLKDIREMFLDTGLEMRSYSILEQGRIGEIINAKPQDRRFLIEEVAGIMKYKVRRAEAENKLQSSRLNLQRIEDILAEVKRQMNSLNRQAKKAERYKEFSDILRDAELRLGRFDYINMVGDERKLKEELSGLKDREAALRREITERENALQQKRLSLLEEEKSIEQDIKILEEKENLRRSLEQKEALLRQERQHDASQIEVLKQRISEYEFEKDSREKEMAEATGKKEQHFMKIGELRTVLSEREVEIRFEREGLMAVEDELDEKRKELFSLTDRIGMVRNDLNMLTMRIDEGRRGIERTERELQEARRRYEELTEEIRAQEGAIEDKRAELKSKADERIRLMGELEDTLEKIKKLTEEKARLREEIASTGARIGSLNEMVKGDVDEGVFREAGVKLVAALSSVVEVPREYERAVEAALADKIRGYIVSDWSDLTTAAGVVARSKFSKTVMLSSKDLVERRESEVPVIEGARPLSQVVSNESPHSELVKNLLWNYLFVEDLEVASRIAQARRLPDYICLVTPDGEVVEKRGVLHCGSGTRILSLRREIRELEEEIENKKGRLLEIDGQIDEGETEAARIRSGLSSTEASMVTIEKEVSTLEAGVNSLKEEQRRFEKKTGHLSMDLERLKTETEEMEKQKTVKEEELARVVAERESLEEEIDLLEAEISEKRSSIDEKTTALGEMRVELEGETERLRAIEKLISDAKSAIESFEKRIKLSFEGIKEKEAGIKEKDEELRRVETELSEVVQTVGRIKSTISGRREEITDTQNELLKEDEEITKLRREVQSLSEEIHALDLRVAEITMNIKGLVNSLNEKYGVDVSREEIDVEGMNPDEERQKVTELKEKLESMGPVNLGALEEHRELSERYEFLKTQHDDVVSSIEELEEAISRINRTTRRLLREAFDGLSKKFNEVFKTLFGGGTAELRLTDEQNILESGIEIVAQPPGKRLQNLNLLSGGEKALAAVSLLFAGFLLKPSPLCILDEADAPLDESNTVRFRDMLRDLSANIQFIVITHNRITMEGADYLYGITMEEPGVSKVLSLEFARD